MDDIELKLEQLRQDWKLLPHKRKIIEIQGKILKMALERRKERQAVAESTETLVRELFF